MKLTTTDSLAFDNFRIRLNKDGTFRFSKRFPIFVEKIEGEWKVEGFDLVKDVRLCFSDSERTLTLSTCSEYNNAAGMSYPFSLKSQGYAHYGRIEFEKVE